MQKSLFNGIHFAISYGFLSLVTNFSSTNTHLAHFPFHDFIASN